MAGAVEKLRIWCDFNSGGWPGGRCWCLRYGEDLKVLDDYAQELGLRVGQQVVLYEADGEFEVDAVLVHESSVDALSFGTAQWMAEPDMASIRYLKP